MYTGAGFAFPGSFYGNDAGDVKALITRKQQQKGTKTLVFRSARFGPNLRQDGRLMSAGPRPGSLATHGEPGTVWPGGG